MSKKRLFTIITGDLVSSRDIRRRGRLSARLPLTIALLSQEFREEFHAPLILTRGIDEVSGVLKRPDKSYRICTFLNQQLYPHQFRFAIVRGTLDVAIDSEDAAKMDGPAFHTAADMIARARKQNRYYYFSLRFRFPEIDQILNELANLVHILRSSWSVHQRRVVQQYLKFERQKAVAKRLRITQQAVSDALRQANLKDIIRAENVIEDILQIRAYYK